MDFEQLQHVKEQQQQHVEPYQQALEAECIVTFGLSQHGKSSFINTISRAYLCNVGSKRESCNKEIEPIFNINKINVKDQIFKFMELPSLDDNCLYDNEEYIKKQIVQLKEILVKSQNTEKPNIKAIIVVLSLQGDTCQLTKCLNEIKKVLKNSSEVEVDNKNIILVLTKWQQKKLDDELQDYLDFHKFNEFSYILWENDIYKGGKLFKAISQDQLDPQLDQLLQQIQICQSYNLGVNQQMSNDDGNLIKQPKIERCGKALQFTEGFKCLITVVAIAAIKNFVQYVAEKQ